jgi:tRNA A-37 threonylcarbamoyl transferase component Bud32
MNNDFDPRALPPKKTLLGAYKKTMIAPNNKFRIKEKKLENRPTSAAYEALWNRKNSLKNIEQRYESTPEPLETMTNLLTSANTRSKGRDTFSASRKTPVPTTRRKVASPSPFATTNNTKDYINLDNFDDVEKQLERLTDKKLKEVLNFTRSRTFESNHHKTSSNLILMTPRDLSNGVAKIKSATTSTKNTIMDLNSSLTHIKTVNYNDGRLVVTAPKEKRVSTGLSLNSFGRRLIRPKEFVTSLTYMQNSETECKTQITQPEGYEPGIRMTTRGDRETDITAITVADIINGKQNINRVNSYRQLDTFNGIPDSPSGRNLNQTDAKIVMINLPEAKKTTKRPQSNYVPTALLPSTVNRLSEKARKPSYPATQLDFSSVKSSAPHTFINTTVNLNNNLKTSTTAKVEQKKVIDGFIIEKVIGSGSYAVVRLAKDEQTNVKYAIKTYDKYKLFDANRRKNVRREISILSTMEHKSIIKLHKTVDTPTQIHLIMEYIGTTSLHGFLKSQPDRKLSEEQAKPIFKQIVEAIAHCHKNNTVHRDIKMENVLINDKKEVKLIDFGFSIIITKDKTLNVFCGTPSYMSPELASKKEYVGQYADIWALGILLFIMLTGKFPFKSSDEKELFKRIAKGSYETPADLSGEAQSILSKMLKVNPADRCSADDILEDNWLQGRTNSYRQLGQYLSNRIQQCKDFEKKHNTSITSEINPQN